MEDKKYPPLPSPVIVEKTKNIGWLKTIFIFFILIAVASALAFFTAMMGLSPKLLTYESCDLLIENATINGTLIGMEYVIAVITQEAIQCNQISMNYANYSYTLFPLECLNLNEVNNARGF